MFTLSVIKDYFTNPLRFVYESDRNRREMPHHFGTYKPSYFKRTMCWLMDEKIDPIDWEEVPFNVDSFDSGNLVADRRTKFQPYECVSQPDMLTRNQIYMRRILLCFAFYGFYRHLENKYAFYNRYFYMHTYYYKHWWLKVFMLSLTYYLTCKQLVDRHSQTTYN